MRRAPAGHPAAVTVRTPLPHPFDRSPFSVAAALDAGISASRMRGGDLERPFYGVRTIPQMAPEGETTAEAEHRLLIAACRRYAPRLGADHFFSHETAARLWGCPLPERFEPTEALHVSNPHRAVRTAGVIGHRVIGVERESRWELPVTGPADTWLALAAHLELDDLVAAGDHLILDPRVLDPRDIRPHVTLELLTERTESFSGRGARAAASALRLLRQGAESRPETLVRLLLSRAGFSGPELQAEIRDDVGRFIGFADLYWPAMKVVVEYDGEHHRTNSAQYARDEGRIEAFIEAKNAVVRVRKGQLFGSPTTVVARVERAFRRQASVVGVELPKSTLDSSPEGR
jgi:very-short-patch-repair endonuclease